MGKDGSSRLFCHQTPIPLPNLTSTLIPLPTTPSPLAPPLSSPSPHNRTPLPVSGILLLPGLILRPQVPGPRIALHLPTHAHPHRTPAPRHSPAPSIPPAHLRPAFACVGDLAKAAEGVGAGACGLGTQRCGVRWGGGGVPEIRAGGRGRVRVGAGCRWGRYMFVTTRLDIVGCQQPWTVMERNQTPTVTHHPSPPHPPPPLLRHPS